jgi:hypothetical protein
VICYFINDKGTRFHRHGITDVNTNLAPLKVFKARFVKRALDKVGDLIENPSPLSPVSHVGILLMNIWVCILSTRLERLSVGLSSVAGHHTNETGSAVLPFSVPHIHNFIIFSSGEPLFFFQ